MAQLARRAPDAPRSRPGFEAAKPNTALGMARLGSERSARMVTTSPAA